MGKVGLIASIIGVVIGAIIAVGSAIGNSYAVDKSGECASLLDQSVRILDENTRSECDTVSWIKAASLGGMIGGGILAVAGIAGAIISSRHPDTPKVLTPEEKLAQVASKMYMSIVAFIVSFISIYFIGLIGYAIAMILGLVMGVMLKNYVLARKEFRRSYKPSA